MTSISSIFPWDPDIGVPIIVYVKLTLKSIDVYDTSLYFRLHTPNTDFPTQQNLSHQSLTRNTFSVNQSPDLLHFHSLHIYRNPSCKIRLSLRSSALDSTPTQVYKLLVGLSITSFNPSHPFLLYSLHQSDLVHHKISFKLPFSDF